jgi:TolB-like protein
MTARPRPALPVGRFVSLLVVVLAGACASVPQAVAPPADEEVRALEAGVAADSSDLRAMLALGEAYRRLDRYEPARGLLERAAARHPSSPETAALLGLTYEDLGLPAEASEQYRSYLRVGRDPALRRHLADRLVLLRRDELIAAARAAVAREAQLTASTPQPATVAVFPFLLQADDPQLAPLGRAMAELLTTDLAQTNRLTVLDRLRVQVLLDEIRLGQAGLADPATAARSGRLLGAERIVQGSVGGTEELLQLRAAVVGVNSQVGGQPVALQEQDPLPRLFDMEKRLAAAVYRAVGIELTAAELERVNRRPTDNVAALLAYGIGLEAEDAGDWGRARAAYSNAVARDPGFASAREHEANAARAERAEAVSRAALARLAAAGGTGDALAEVQALVPDASGRDPVAEFLGQEGIGRSGAVLRVILP